MTSTSLKTDPTPSDSLIEDKAILHAATCFLNSFLREWHTFKLSSTAFENSAHKNVKHQIEIPVLHGRTLCIPIKRYSLVGRHEYQGSFLLTDDQHVKEVTFLDLVSLLTDLLGETYQTDSTQLSSFQKRVGDSLANTKEALAYWLQTEHSSSSACLIGQTKSVSTFKNAEQSLIIGHSFHPTPKSRGEFTPEDRSKYSPELGGRFPLQWFMADPDIIHHKTALTFQSGEWSYDLAAADLSGHASSGLSGALLPARLEELSVKGYMAIPMHPWQFKILTSQSGTSHINEHLATGKLVYIGDSYSFWDATSSLRTVYRASSPFMLKFSMSVKLTNSIRHLLFHEVDRGLQLHDVLNTSTGQQFLAKHPQFKIMTEPAYLAIKGVDGQPLSESIVVGRMNPFNDATCHNHMTLATLTQSSFLGGPGFLAQHIQSALDDTTPLKERGRKWFRCFLKVVVYPLLDAHANFGIVLGAHQQNLVLKMKDGYPVAAYFRDCQSTGYTEFGFANFAKDVPTINRANGNVVDQQMANSLLIYYLILNSTFNVIAAIADMAAGSKDSRSTLLHAECASEDELINELKSFLYEMRESGVRDPSCINHLLGSKTLMHKGNFICSFKNINENTSRDPLAIYSEVENPICLQNLLFTKPS